MKAIIVRGNADGINNKKKSQQMNVGFFCMIIAKLFNWFNSFNNSCSNFIWVTIRRWTTVF